MKFLEVALAILIAFLVQTVLGRYFVFLNIYLDLFIVVAATFGLVRGRMVGLCTGTAAGLLDAHGYAYAGLQAIVFSVLLDMTGSPWPVLFLAMAGTRIISAAMITAVKV